MRFGRRVNMQEIHLKESDIYTEEQSEQFSGMLLDESHYDILINNEDEPTIVYKPGGDKLLVYVPRVLSSKNCKRAYSNLRDAATKTENRGYAGGYGDEGDGYPTTKFRKMKSDGTISNTRVARNPVNSGIIGYFDRNPRFPYCRTTAYNLKKGHKFQRALPFIKEINNVFRYYEPDRYNAQLDIVKETSEDFYIHETVFTTVTVNKNWQTAVHQDAGDYRPGFGVLTVLRAGDFDGCYFCFPRYKVAVDMQTRCVLLADVHEWHGNTPLKGVPGMYERISFVLYYRENMKYCGSATEELERAKNRELGTKLNG